MKRDKHCLQIMALDVNAQNASKKNRDRRDIN